MSIDTWLAIIGIVLAYGTALVAGYVNINVKIKELEMRITSLRDSTNSDISNLANLVAAFIIRSEKCEDENKQAHEKVLVKIDEVKDSLSNIKIELNTKT